MRRDRYPFRYRCSVTRPLNLILKMKIHVPLGLVKITGVDRADLHPFLKPHTFKEFIEILFLSQKKKIHF